MALSAELFCAACVWFMWELFPCICLEQAEGCRNALSCLSSHQSPRVLWLSSAPPGLRKGQSISPASPMPWDRLGIPHGRKGAQSETIDLHDLMQAAGENNNKKGKTLKAENWKLLIGRTGAIQEPKYKHKASSSMPGATWDIHTGMAELILVPWKPCSLLEQQLGARCDTLRHQKWH